MEPRGYRGQKTAARFITVFALIVGNASQASDYCDAPASHTNDKPIGKIISTSAAKLRHPSSNRRDATTNDCLYLRTELVTDRGGRLTLELIPDDAAQANDTEPAPVIHLGPNSSLTLQPKRDDTDWVLDLLRGWLHFFSGRRSDLDVDTPYITAGVRGTEFTLHTQDAGCDFYPGASAQGCSALWVQTGEVTARSPKAAPGDPSTVTVNVSDDKRTFNGAPDSKNNGVIAVAGQPPEPARLTISPQDAVDWVIYYPPLVQPHKRVPGAPETAALQRLDAGDITGAKQLLDERIARDANATSNAPVYALRSVVALKQNDKQGARENAEQAIKLNDKLADGHLALSYAQQAEFDLDAARSSTERAAELAPNNALIAARQAELSLSLDDSANALKQAQHAVDLALATPGADSIDCDGQQGTPSGARNAELSRAWSVLGFTQLIRLDTARANANLQRAICADDLAPLPRLGLGLAQIREGQLDSGVRQIEIAVALDPLVSLYRSYLGKGYFEQDRFDLAKKELALAKRFDKQDPTPWLYDAFVAGAENDPIGALAAIEESKQRNDNRAVYRSRLLLDSDDAVRATSLGRTYQELGFDQLARLEATKSLLADPGNYSAHRFMADAYSRQPRQYIARVSESLQARIRAPRAQHPPNAKISVNSLRGFNSSAALVPAANEYSRLFEQDGVRLTASALVGSKDTLEEEILFSWAQGPLSAAITQYHFETDGFRPKHYQNQQYWNILGQYRLSPRTSVHFEYQNLRWDHGDLYWYFDSTSHAFEDTADDLDSLRIGFHHVFTPTFDNVTFIRKNDYKPKLADDGTPSRVLDVWRVDSVGKQVETQFISRHSTSNLVFGGGSYEQDRGDYIAYKGFLTQERPKWATNHRYFYTYYTHNFPTEPSNGQTTEAGNSSVTIGASYTDYDQRIKYRLFAPGFGLSPLLSDPSLSIDRVLPKLGLTLNTQLASGLPITARAAYFQTIKRPLLGNETLEPTSIAGFNQFTDDPDGALSETTAFGVDVTLSPRLRAGLEFMYRDIDLTAILQSGPPGSPWGITTNGVEEKSGEFYVYYTPNRNWSLATTFKRLVHDRDLITVSPLLTVDSTTNIVTTKINYFASPRLTLSVAPTWLYQKGEFVNRFTPFKGNDDAWVIDLSASYDIPHYGANVSLIVQNLLDYRYRYQDEEAYNSRFHPERTASLRVKLDF